MTQVQGELSRRNLKHFLKQFWHVIEPSTPFVDGWVIDAYVDHLTHIRDIRNLLVNVPVGCSKSIVFCVMFFCWQWLKEPSSRFLYISHDRKLAQRDQTKCRRLIGSDLYQKCYGSLYGISDDNDTKQIFENDKTGFRQITSVNAGVTGLKCNFLVCDDPHQGSETEFEREKSVKWFIDYAWNRLADFSRDCRIIIGQRIARDDLSGFLLENYASELTHLCLPYEYRRHSTTVPNKIGWTDPRTEEGEPLWIDRYPASAIEIEKKRPSNYSTQWLMLPIDSANAVFRPEHFKTYAEELDRYELGADKVALKRECFTVITCDIAYSTGKRSDYTAAVVADITRTGDILIRHVMNERLKTGRIIPSLAALCDQYNPAYVMIEDRDQAILEQARASGLPVRALRHGNMSKDERSIPLQLKCEAGQLWFPKDAPWLNEAQTQLMQFPHGAHDDIPDCLFYLAMEANKRTRVRVSTTQEPTRPEKTYEEMYREAVVAGIR